MSERIAMKKLLHWNQRGELVLKNKVKEAILRENAHEERSLDSTLNSLDRHKNQEQRYLANKQQQFAATIMKSHHERQHVEASYDNYEHKRQRSLSFESLQETHESEHDDSTASGRHKNNSPYRKQDVKCKWKKAMKEKSAVRNSNHKKHHDKRSKEGAVTLPSLDLTDHGSRTWYSRKMEHETEKEHETGEPRGNHGMEEHGTRKHGTGIHRTGNRGTGNHETEKHGTVKHGKGQHGTRRHDDEKHARKETLNLPDIHQKKRRGDFLQDPRFKKLQEVLSQRPETHDLEDRSFGKKSHGRLRSFSNQY